MFFEALQAYYAPTITLVIFVFLVLIDKLHSQKIKCLFLIESALLLIIIVSTWTDRCLSAMDMGGMAWKLRLMTSFINFALSPLSPAILIEIYRKNVRRRSGWLLYLPEMCNIILCATCLFNGCIFNINSANVYTRGPLFFIPFLVSLFYMFSLIMFSLRGNSTPSRHAETFFLALIMSAIALAAVIEVVFVKRFMIWSTTEICVILYYMVLNSQKTIYDGLSGTFSRVAYMKQMEKIDQKKNCAIAMVDLNGLKYFNDNFGHAAGDMAICSVADAILKHKNRNMKLFRYGGDEFVLIGKNQTVSEMENVLQRALNDCTSVCGKQVTFAYGVSGYQPELDLHKVTAEADDRMYENKKVMK